jgi:hypothetical protein
MSVGQISPNGRTIPTGPHAPTCAFHFNPVRELEWMIRALGIFKRNKIPIEEKAHALHLHMAGLSS